MGGGAAEGQGRALHSALRAWFRLKRRELPWRTEPRDPWATLVSEAMLQQTRVDAVVPRFAAFMERWPTPAAMARSTVDDVLAAWSGLGYYDRARRLHAAAVALVDFHGGDFPRDEATLRSLPGVGDYTVGAVGSMALGLRLPLVDGNVARVLARLFAVEGDVTKGAAARRVKSLAAGLLPPRGAGEWNEGLMELGALVCLPGRPRCGHCPLEKRCAARAAGRENELPGARRKSAPRAVRQVAALVDDGAGRTLLLRRPDGGLLSGTWELPGAEVAEGEEPRDALAAALAKQLGGTWTVGPRRATVRHSILDRRITLDAHSAEPAPRPDGRPGRLPTATAARLWATDDQLPTLPHSSLVAKVWRAR